MEINPYEWLIAQSHVLANLFWDVIAFPEDTEYHPDTFGLLEVAEFQGKCFCFFFQGTEQSFLHLHSIMSWFRKWGSYRGRRYSIKNSSKEHVFCISFEEFANKHCFHLMGISRKACHFWDAVLNVVVKILVIVPPDLLLRSKEIVLVYDRC